MRSLRQRYSRRSWPHAMSTTQWKNHSNRSFRSCSAAGERGRKPPVRSESFTMSTPTPLANYKSYKNLPPLAGLCTVEEPAKPGLLVEECVRRLKRFHYCFKRLHQILTARITAEPIYELKTGFSHHAYLCAEHVTALRTRIGE